LGAPEFRSTTTNGVEIMTAGAKAHSDQETARVNIKGVKEKMGVIRQLKKNDKYAYPSGASLQARKRNYVQRTADQSSGSRQSVAAGLRRERTTLTGK